MIGIIAIIAVVLVAAGAWYYYKNISQGPAAQSPTHTGTTVSSTDLFRANNITDANDQFAFDLYQRYAGEKDPNANVFFSPFSISSAMAMVYEGAKGQTAQEIGSVFHFPTDIGQVRSGYQAALNSFSDISAPASLTTANAIWVQNGYQLLSDYTDAIKTYYDGSIANVDFENEPVVAASTINQWVDVETAGKIQDIVPPAGVDPHTRLILTNAIYFKDAWNSPFEKYMTQEKDFTANDGSHVQASMMEQTSNFSYADTGTAQLLQLPYRDSNTSMVIILPKNGDLSALEGSLSYAKVNGWEQNASDQLVDVSLPKFTIQTDEHMPTDLEAMGMPTAFSPTDADFSGIAPIPDPSKNLYISDVIHKAFIDTDEDGTEAAAATAVVVAEPQAIGPRPTQQPIVFNADHPFMFFIQQDQTSNILFAGRVVDPADD